MSDAGPKLSVLVVTHNHEKYIRQALDSVIMQQTCEPVEIVIVDDCSKDSTPQIVAEYEQRLPQLRLITSPRNLGITRNYERGFAACRGEYVAILEGDDYWILPSKLSTISAFLDQHPECAFCFHRFVRHDDLSNTVTLHPRFEIDGGFAVLSASKLARENFIGNFSACVYRRDAIKRLDPSLFSMKVYDWMFNLAMAQMGMIGYLPEIMSVYRAHQSGTWSTKSPDEWRPELLELIDTYNEYLEFKFNREFQALKGAVLVEMRESVRRANGRFPSRSRRIWRWLTPLMPPVLTNLARNIYHRSVH